MANLRGIALLTEGLGRPAAQRARGSFRRTAGSIACWRRPTHRCRARQPRHL